MTPDKRPTSKITTVKTREVEHILSETEVEEILTAYLTKTFPEFRGFNNDEFDFQWTDNNCIIVKTWKEEKR